MSFQHCVLSSLSSSDILYYFLHACVLSRSAQQMCRPHTQNLPITGFSRMFYNEIMHSYPVYLLKGKEAFLMIDYSPLWNTLKSKGISQYRLIRSYHFSSGQLHRIRKNEHVSTHTLETLCRILNCSVADIVRISFDRVEKES